MFKCVAEVDGVRVDKYVRSVFPGIAQSFIEKSLRKGSILLNGSKVLACTRVKIGDVLSIKDVEQISTKERKKGASSATHCDAIMRSLSGMIAYEDEHVVVLNKPAGISVQGGTKIRASIDDVLDRIVPGVSLRIVHRLDRDTSGVLVLSKSLDVARCFAEEMRSRRVQKEYIAITHGVPDAIGEITHPVFYKRKKPSDAEKEIVNKEAKTLFSVVVHRDGHAIVSLQPLTGRKHQLRIHLSTIGCPIVGDTKYSKDANKGDNLHLHARKIGFEIMGKKVEVFAPVPNYMRETAKTLFGIDMEHFLPGHFTS
ncbi:RluA family pseudouridine synthase [Anaplasma bovis]|uniref:RluA family pseudouridine synthase n=1 Tax=Anaplasma bovis TaxID=186733 RepID=UPI002FF195B6